MKRRRLGTFSKTFVIALPILFIHDYKFIRSRLYNITVFIKTSLSRSRQTSYCIFKMVLRTPLVVSLIALTFVLQTLTFFGSDINCCQCAKLDSIERLKCTYSLLIGIIILLVNNA